MGATTKGLRWPEPTARVAEGSTAIRSLAEDVDSALLSDTGWTALALATGWGGTAFYRARGKAVVLTCAVTRTGAAVAGGVLAAISAPLPVSVRPSADIFATFTIGWTTPTGCYIDNADGGVKAGALTIAQNAVMRGSFAWTIA